MRHSHLSSTSENSKEDFSEFFDGASLLLERDHQVSTTLAFGSKGRKGSAADSKVRLAHAELSSATLRLRVNRRKSLPFIAPGFISASILHLPSSRWRTEIALGFSDDHLLQIGLFATHAATRQPAIMVHRSEAPVQVSSCAMASLCRLQVRDSWQNAAHHPGCRLIRAPNFHPRSSTDQGTFRATVSSNTSTSTDLHISFREASGSATRTTVQPVVSVDVLSPSRSVSGGPPRFPATTKLCCGASAHLSESARRRPVDLPNWKCCGGLSFPCPEKRDF